MLSKNVQKICSFSGFPNCKWSTMPIGTPPTQIVLRTDSARTPKVLDIDQDSNVLNFHPE